MHNYDDAAKYQSGLSGLPGGILGQQSGAAAPAEPFTGPIMRADGSLDELLSRVNRVADRLCGAIPQNAQNKLASVPSGGVFDEISTIGSRMHSKLSEVHEAVARIERMLP